MLRRSNPVDDVGSRTSSSLSPESLNLSRLLSQHQDHSHKNQTLEEAFARLSVAASPFNRPSFGHVSEWSSGLDGASSIFPLRSNWFHHPHQSSNPGQTQESMIGFKKPSRNNIAAAAANDRDGLSLNGSWSGSYPTFSASGYSSSGTGFLDSEPLARQIEFGSAFRNVPLSSGGGGELQQKSHGGLLNESLGDRSNIPWVNVNSGRSPHWLDEFRGRVLSLAKDQYGSRILQETMKHLGTEGVSFIFSELISHVTELMVDPFGNYVIQKMVEICTEEQRTQIILMVTEHNFQLVTICLSPHGTRAMEKFLEHVTTQEQRALIMSALSPDAVALAKDINGHRVVLQCLKRFTEGDTKQFLNQVANNSFGIARDKTGCVVLQHCVSHAQGETKKKLIADIILNASLLAEDCYGNYVVQHLLSLKIPIVTDSLLRQLEGKFSYLACNKYGSNVVEKFFQDSGELHSTRIILELLRDPNVARLLVDPYGNYVIRSALLASKGAIRNALLELIQINSQMMRSNLYGKKLLDRFDRGKIRHI